MVLPDPTSWVSDPGPGPTGPSREPEVDDPSAQGGLRALVHRARSGDETASRSLFAGVHRLAHRYARARLGTYPAAAELAADVAQEVCMAVMTALPRYEDRGAPFEAFVYRVAAHKVADAGRVQARQPVPVDHQRSDVLDSVIDSAERTVVEGDQASRAWSMLACLPARLREIVMLRVGVGLSAQETADALGMTAGAVRVAQHRALRELRARWEQEET